MGAVEEDSIRRAILYRDEWDLRIENRAKALQRLRGSEAAFAELWETYRKIYDKTNSIEGQPPGSFQTIFDIDPRDIEDASSSPVERAGARHASKGRA